jgi:YfiH family protein
VADAPVRVDLGRATGWFTGASLDGVADANLAHHRRHVPARLAEARAAVGAATGTDHRGWHLMRQVHGAEVGVVGASTPRGAELRDVDALVTAEPDRVLVVLAADCLPVLIGGRSSVAAVHAGWRGIVADVAGRAVDAMAARGEDPAELVVAVGPAIGPCCYEVGSDVADLVERAAPGAVVAATPGGRPHVDLVAALRRRLQDVGVPAPVHVGPCTRCGPGAWFSHRRDPAAGRQAALVRMTA